MREAISNFTDFLEEAVTHYETTAPTVAAHCDDLYRRLTTKVADSDSPRMIELIAVGSIHDEKAGWLLPNVAANLIYKIRHRLGMDVTGHAGF